MVKNVEERKKEKKRSHEEMRSELFAGDGAPYILLRRLPRPATTTTTTTTDQKQHPHHLQQKLPWHLLLLSCVFKVVCSSSLSLNNCPASSNKVY